MRKQTANFGRMTENGYSLMQTWGKFMEKGHIKIRAVRCGKSGCRTCPHAWYAYFVSPHGNERYLGVCNKDGTPREKYK